MNPQPRTPRPGVAGRLFLTVWLVYAAFLTSNVVRETYLAVALGDDLTVRVDTFLGLHPDLFEIPGRGAYINSNPGASMLGAVPYALSRPAVALLFQIRPALGRPKPPAQYDDPRPNRARLMNAMRARGLDVKLALAAFAVQLGLMAPLGATAVMLLYRYLTARLGDERRAFWIAVLYAFGTPLFFRAAFLNQNAILAHLVLFAWMLLTWPGRDVNTDAPRRWLMVGGLLGLGILCDYSAAPMAVAFGLWAMWEGWRHASAAGGVRRAVLYCLGAAAPIALLLLYQDAAFGSPWFPAQRYMPATEFSMRGTSGFTVPTVDLMWRNWLDPRYGLFAFCPLLLLALGSSLVRGRPGAPARHELAFAWLASLALWLFSSANQFANLQWNTGVRYMVPATPLLFVLAVPVLLALPRLLRWAAIAPTLLITAAVTMTREDVPTALRLLFTEGPTLPMLIVLRKTAAAYAPFLARGTVPLALAAYLALAAVVWAVWRWRRAAPQRPPAAGADTTAGEPA